MSVGVTYGNPAGLALGIFLERVMWDTSLKGDRGTMWGVSKL